MDRRKFLVGLGGAAAVGSVANAEVVQPLPIIEPKFSAEANLIKAIVEYRQRPAFLFLLRDYQGTLRVTVNPPGHIAQDGTVRNMKKIWDGDYQFPREYTDIVAADLRRMYPTSVIYVEKYADVQSKPVKYLNGEICTLNNGNQIWELNGKVFVQDTVERNNGWHRVNYEVTFDKVTHLKKVAEDHFLKYVPVGNIKDFS